MTSALKPVDITIDRPAQSHRPSGPSRQSTLTTSPTPRPRFRRPGSAARLASLHALVLAVVLGGSVIALLRNSRTANEEVAARGLAAQLRTFREAAVIRPAGTDLFAFSTGYLRTHAVASGEAVIISVTGQGTVGSPGSAPALEDPLVERQLSQPPARTTTRPARVSGTPVELLTAPIVEHGKPAGTFVGTGDLSMFGSVQSRILEVSTVEAVIALIVGVASAFLLLRRLLRTIGRMTRTADTIGQSNLDERLGDQETDDEVGQLAQSFDAMLDRVAASIESERRLLSDVSHQLRTPLTVVRGHLEVLARTDLGDQHAVGEAIDLVVDELDHMRTLIERLSTFGQALERDSLTLERVNLRTLLTELYHACNVLAGRRWLLGTVPSVTVTVDVNKVRGAVFNLVDNAVKATRPGGRIGLAATTDGRDVRIHVGDSGKGIPAVQRAAVLGRFSRPGARDGGGSGLGLAIVKAVAEAHRGSVEVGTSTFGGALVTIVIPIAGDQG